ncbi:MAG: FliH/SctL family protein [Burkholderiaceae bacterium]
MRSRSRFIPGEEIGAVAQWNFGAVDTDALLLEAASRARQEQQDFAHDETVRQQAHAHGFAEGYAQGQARAAIDADHRIAEFERNQGQAAADRFSALMQSTQEQLDQSAQVMAEGVLALACEIARKVLRQELSVNPNLLQPVVREALGLLSADNKSAVVRLNPLDADVLADALKPEFATLALTLVADPAVRPGGCMVTSAGTVVDASVETRWRRAVASLGMNVDWDEPA